ncbi:hypothetical protein H5410_006029 [Solanum commersonii]|uniref:Uncharacterized protein n=1 Tax=Solanum commersonii TaxID=4109 RepID=A0A9J6A954_SOLCO|nr:hypothetical protein H5410_006029 [Solanum commersonii]
MHRYELQGYIPEARLCINLYALVNKRNLKQLKSDPSRLRYECVVGCHFSLHISGDKDMSGVRIKTLKSMHDCNDNGRVDHLTIAYCFKSKLQNDPKYRFNDTRNDLKERLDVNVSHGSFIDDDYNRLEAYANELRSSNPRSDVIINILKDALANGKRRFLRIFCVKRVEANWCKTWRSKELQKAFWRCSWTTYEEDFKDKLNMIGSLDKTAAEDLLKYPLNVWCRAHFDTPCARTMKW